MKITKLLCIKLVAPNYIVVDDAGTNRTIKLDHGHTFKTNDMYTLVEEPEFFRDEEKKPEITEQKDSTEELKIQTLEKDTVEKEDESI